MAERIATTCQCCAQGKDAERATKGKARCCAKKPAECCGQVAGTGTLRYLLRLVRAALQDAVEEELLARNVARQVKMPTGSIRKVTPWSADEARTFLEMARHDRLYALWAVALAIGLRRGEALGLRWVDVDLVNGRVVIAKALSRVGTNLALRDVKTESSAASVPLPDELVAILRRHRLDQLGDTQVARGNSLGLVFTTKNGTPLEPRKVNRSFETLCRRANVRCDDRDVCGRDRTGSAFSRRGHGFSPQPRKVKANAGGYCRQKCRQRNNSGASPTMESASELCARRDSNP
jgi:integrase